MFKISDVLKHKEERMSDRKLRKVYWTGSLGHLDNFGNIYTDVMYDGKTKIGPWANMNEGSWKKYGVGKLGTGYGQKYKKQPDGLWLKIEG